MYRWLAQSWIVFCPYENTANLCIGSRLPTRFRFDRQTCAACFETFGVDSATAPEHEPVCSRLRDTVFPSVFFESYGRRF